MVENLEDDVWKMAKRIFGDQFQSDDDCYNHIFTIKYPDGFRCKKCGSRGKYCKFDRVYKIRKIPIIQCSDCHTQTSILSNTIFCHTRIPIVKWFLGLYIVLTVHKNDMRITTKTVYTISEKVNICYSTAWKMQKDIQKGIIDNDPFCRLDNYPLAKV